MWPKYFQHFIVNCLVVCKLCITFVYNYLVKHINTNTMKAGQKFTNGNCTVTVKEVKAQPVKELKKLETALVKYAELQDEFLKGCDNLGCDSNSDDMPKWLDAISDRAYNWGDKAEKILQGLSIEYPANYLTNWVNRIQNKNNDLSISDCGQWEDEINYMY